MNRFQENYNPKHQQVFLLTLIGLLILRIPFFAGMYFFNLQQEWTYTVFDIGTYLLTTFLIWYEIDNLSTYHIDTLAVIIIVLFKPVQSLMLNFWGTDFYNPAFPVISSLAIWLIAIFFILGVWWKRTKLPSIKLVNLGWLLIGLLAGLITSVVLSFPWSYQISVNSLPYRFLDNNVLKEITSLFFYQVGFPAISEEPLFRGFLWGYLRTMKWKDIWIFLFQAGLFTLSHIYYISAPISFWIIVPIVSLVLGWLAWRSRTITSSMMAHGMINAALRPFGYLIAMYRFG